MDASDVAEIFLSRLGIRLEPEMSAYVLRRMEPATNPADRQRMVPILGGDARTGQPVWRVIDLSILAAGAIMKPAS